MSKLILLRHLESQWNKENRFTGWTDVPLSKEGEKSAKKVAKNLVGFHFDKVYTSPLARNKKTVSLVLKNLKRENLPVIINKALNERHYGKLQGLNKGEIKKKYGQKKVQQWRRGWEHKPPGGESLKDVFKRTTSFYKKYIEKDLKNKKNVLIVGSHNSLRALVKYIENISDKKIVNLEIPSAGIIEYDFDELLNLKSKKKFS